MDNYFPWRFLSVDRRVPTISEGPGLFVLPARLDRWSNGWDALEKNCSADCVRQQLLTY